MPTQPIETAHNSIKAVLLDFDGVILDSMEPTYQGCCAVFKACEMAPPTREEFCATYDLPWIDYYRRTGVHADAEDIKRIFYAEIKKHKTALFPGAREVLKVLRENHILLGIVSAREIKNLLSELKKEKLFGLFDFVAEAEHKDEETLKFCRAFYLDPSEVLFVGDLSSDIRDGNKAGARTVLFKGNKFKFPDREIATYVIYNLREVLELVEDIPKIGNHIYVPNSNSRFPQRDYTVGGLGQVDNVEKRESGSKEVHFIGVREHPGKLYNWE